MTFAPLEREDYEEPRCLLNMDPPNAETPVSTIPQLRVREKLDEYMSRRDYDGAERHLRYWLEEARAGRDLRGELMVRNELIGHYRKTGNRDAALTQADAAIALLEPLGLGGSVSAGTTYVNAATAMNAFGENERALELFHRARETYEAASADEALLGGLYNNLALVETALGRYDDAAAHYERAMAIMGRQPNGALEQAITCLNMADLAAARYGMERGEARIFTLLDQAQELLDRPEAPRDGYYAFVCEKCAPSFEYYGYFLAAEELKRRARAIYERT